MLNIARIHAVLCQRIHQDGAVFTDYAGVIHRAARFGDGDGLVEPFSTGEHVLGDCHLRFARSNHVFNLIDVVDIHGTVVENLHAGIPPEYIVTGIVTGFSVADAIWGLRHR